MGSNIARNGSSSPGGENDGENDGEGDRSLSLGASEG